ncbi:MAG TPA: hypothetical protein VN495_04545 [Candidatus Paceibacterota bacterium]|nr:hypothetical protein [Candidatus Paceibacterota bacterium]
MHTRGVAEKISQWALFLLVGVAPFFVIPTAWASVDQAKVLLIVAGIGVALIAYVIARLSEGFMLIPRSATLLAALLLPLAYLISAFLLHGGVVSYVSGVARADTVVSMMILFTVLALTPLIFAKRASEQVTIAFLLRALFIGIGVVVVVQIIRLAFPTALQLGGVLAGSASSVVGSWHDLGILLALAIFLITLVWNVPSISRGAPRMLLVGLGILAFFFLFLIGMPDVWYLLAAAEAVLGISQWISAQSHEGLEFSDAFLRGFVALGVGVLMLFGGLFTPFFVAHVPSVLQIGATDVRPSWASTLSVGAHVLHGGDFIFGSGPNTFSQVWSQFKPSDVNQTQFWSTDFSSGVGLVPTALVTVGALGALAWVLLLLALFVALLRALARERFSLARRPLLAALFGACFLGVFLVLDNPGFLIVFLFFLLAGASILSAAERPHGFMRLPLSFRLGGLGVLASLLVFCALAVAALVYSARATISDLLVNDSIVVYNDSGNITHSLALIQSSLAIYPENDAAHRAAVQLGLLQLQQLLAAGSASNTAALQAQLAQTIQEGLQAVSINSGDYQNWLALAGLYQSLGGAGISGAYDNALSAYQKAAVAGPTNPLPLIGAAQIESAKGDEAAALKYLNAAIALTPNLAAPYYLRSQVEAALGALTPALTDAKTTVSIAQQDPLGWYNLGLIFYARAEYPSAVLALKQAVSLQQNYANALFALALSEDKVGDSQDALATIQQVVQLNPSDTTAQMVLSNLQNGQPALATTTPTTKKKTQ